MAFFEIYGQQNSLTQWDVGRKLIVNGVCTHVHYANSAMSEAIPCEVTESNGMRTAPIPDEVLQVGGVLWVYAVVLGEEGYTKRIQSFFVKERSRPANYVYTPTEVMTWEGLHERVELLEESGGPYYMPAVKQIDSNTMQVSFAASSEKLPEVAEQAITLPAGPQGEKGDTGADGVGIQSIYITEV